MSESIVTDKFPCVLCNQILPSKSELQAHFRNHGNEPTQSSKKKNVKKQQETKCPNKPKASEVICCDVCKEEFSSNTLAIQHKFKKHPEVHDKYYCPSCGMLFTIKGLYDRHYASHKEGEKERNALQITCESCGAVFSNNGAHDYHVKTTHKRVMKLYQPIATAPPSKKIKVNNAGDVQSVYYCHICGCEYIVKFNLQKHLELYHTEEERSEAPTDLIRCTVCDALFYNRKAYDSHNMGHKPDDLYVTNEQQRLRTISRIDQDFDYRRVLPLAQKYVPGFKEKKMRKVCNESNDKKGGDEEQDDLSPPSSPGSSDSESENPAPSDPKEGCSTSQEDVPVMQPP